LADSQKKLLLDGLCPYYYNVVVMAAEPNTNDFPPGDWPALCAEPLGVAETVAPLRKAHRRSFLALLAGVGLALRAPVAEAMPDKKSEAKSRTGAETKPETAYRLLTPECEVQIAWNILDEPRPRISAFAIVCRTGRFACRRTASKINRARSAFRARSRLRDTIFSHDFPRDRR
jgi:hypothetical protein